MAYFILKFFHVLLAIVAIGANITYGGNTILNSNHTNGLNTLMTDGSVRFVSSSIDFATWQRACTRDDGLAPTGITN